MSQQLSASPFGGRDDEVSDTLCDTSCDDTACGDTSCGDTAIKRVRQIAGNSVCAVYGSDQ